MKKKSRQLFIVVSAPSGAGKTSLCEKLLERDKHIRYSVSCTTRKPREGEVDGEHYHFMSRKDFEAKIAKDDFLEYAEVHGNYYGTLKDTVTASMNAGYDVLMDLDVQGAQSIRKLVSELEGHELIRNGFFDLFIAPPSLQDLRARIVHRGKDSVETIETRMANAEAEMNHWHEYAYMLINDSFDVSLKQLEAIVSSERNS